MRVSCVSTWLRKASSVVGWASMSAASHGMFESNGQCLERREAGQWGLSCDERV